MIVRRLPAALGLVALAVIAAAAWARGVAQEDPITLVLGGDVIFDNPIEYALRRTGRSREDAASYAPLFSDIAPSLAAADYAVVNLETPVAERHHRSGDGDPPRFAAPRAFLSALTQTGVDAVTLANNHAYDQAVAGLAETIAALDAEGLAYAGAGDDPARARVAVVQGHRVALLAFAEGTNWRVREEEAASPRIALLDEERIRAAVAAARAEAELVVVAFHWTEGPDRLPTARMRRWASCAAEAGADLLWGHGTHLPAGGSVLRTTDGRDVPSLWSLGNLVAVMEEGDEAVHEVEPSVRDAVLARVTLVPEAGRLAVRGIEAEAFWIGISEREDEEPFVRPLALELERRALFGRDGCGRCERLARSYERREHRARSLFRLDESPLEVAVRADEPAPEAPVVRAEPPRERPEPHAEAPRAEVAETSPPAPVEEVGETGPSAPPRVEVAETRPSAPRVAARDRPAERPSRPGGEVALTTRAEVVRPPPPSDVVDRQTLRITWTGARALEATVDEAQLRAIAARLRADAHLRLRIVAHASGEDDRRVWRLRASRAAGLVAILGPSRSRIDAASGAPEDPPRLEIVLSR